MKKITTVLLCSIVVINMAWAASQETFELSHKDFLSEVFGATLPDSERIWIRGELKEQIESILQHPVTFLRTQYWLEEGRSVWILDEVGKEKPITSGIVISYEAGVSEIVGVKVLAYRESRGWEIKNTFFTDQFKGVRREVNKNKSKLTPTIDGITGATLSVRALRKTAEIALLLDEHVRKEN